MFTHTYDRELAADAGRARTALLATLPGLDGCTIVDEGEPIVVRRAGGERGRRFALTARLTPGAGVLRMSIHGGGESHGEFAAEIAAALPEGILADQGLPAALAAMARPELVLGGFELRHLANELIPGERVLMMASCHVRRNLSLAVLTDRRLLVKDRKLLRYGTREVVLAKITSLTTLNKISGDMVAVTAPNVTLRMKGMHPGRGKTFSDLLRTRIDAAAAPAAEAGAPAGAGEVRALAALRERGLLTDAEFTVAKHRALGLGGAG